MAFETFGDIRKMALTKAGEVETNQSKYWDKMLEYVQISYLDILSGSNKFNLDFKRAWSWARESEPKRIVLKAPVDGQCTLTNGTIVGTFSVAPTVSLQGYYLYIENVDEIYRVVGHAANSTSFTVDTEFIGTTGSFTYKAVKLVYDLGDDVLRLVEPFVSYKRPAYGNGDYQVYSMGLSRFKTEYPLRLIRQGMPAYFAETNSKDDKLEVIFSGYVDSDTRLDVDYIKMPTAMSATDKPLVPFKDREVIAFCAAAMLLFNEKTQPDKGSIIFNLAKTKLDAMLEEDCTNLESTGHYFGRIIPRPEQINNPYKYLYRRY